MDVKFKGEYLGDIYYQPTLKMKNTQYRTVRIPTKINEKIVAGSVYVLRIYRIEVEGVLEK